MSEKIPVQPLRFLLAMSRPYAWWAVSAVTCVIIANTCETSLSYVLKMLTNAATHTVAVMPHDIHALAFWATVYTLGFFFTTVFWRLSGFSGMQWLTSARAHSYRTLFSYITRHSANYFSNRFAGSIATKVANASDSSGGVVQVLLWQMLPILTSFIISLVLAYSASPWLALLLGVWMVGFLATDIMLVRMRLPHAKAAALAGSTLRGVIVDAATNIAAVHQAGHHSFEEEFIGGYVDTTQRAIVKSWWTSEWILVINGLYVTVFIGGILSICVWLLNAGRITLGDTLMMISLSVQMYRTLMFVGNNLNRLIDDYGVVQDALQELLLPHDIVDIPGAKPLAVTKGIVEFRDVSFSYGEKRSVFEHLQLSIHTGEKVGIVGLSGAGKSTLASILLRQYEVQQGGIFIDGQNINDVTIESLRKSVAFVPQDISLFHRSILENIRYGRLDATDQEVQRAATLAQAADFIARLPQGYQSLVGERGVKLSGGQRQRIAVARAILKNAPILVLDEATSALDSESEAYIQQALEQLMKGKTVLAIAHRLSTLKVMDRIIVLDEGKLVEDGTHAQLLKNGGTYARLWESQVSGFIQE